MHTSDWWLRLAQPRNWLFFLAAYLLIHMGMRLLLSDTLQLDDAEQLIQSQQWRLDYGNFQPPLYTWFLWALWHLIEPSMWALYVLRYLIIGLAFWLWYRVSCLLFKDPRWIVASATSWLLLDEFGWKLHQGSTHTTLLTLALIMSLHAIVLLLRSPEKRYYLYLGFAVGLGMMAKYSYAGFLLPMLVAALVAKDTRDRLLRWPMLFTVVGALLIMSPVMWTLLAPEVAVGEQLHAETRHSEGGLLSADLSLLFAFAKGSLNFLAPLFLIYLTLFRVSFRPELSSADHGSPVRDYQEAGLRSGRGQERVTSKGGQQTADAVRILLDCFHVAGWLSVLVVAVFVGIDDLKVRWLHPFLTLIPFWWLLHAAPNGQRKQTWQVLKWITVALVVLVLVARLWQLLATPYIGKKPSRVTWPVMEALEQVPREVLHASQVRVADAFLGGHVRLLTDSPVSVEEPVSSGEPGGTWLWGSSTKQSSGEPDESPGTLTGSVRWFSAEKGRAVYRVACAGNSSGLGAPCRP